MAEIKRLGGSNAVISTNIPLRNDGLPYAKFKKLEDTGVAVYFQYNQEQVVFACDQWESVEENMQAIRKSIEAIRGLERWGVSDMLRRMFTGFRALPETAGQNGSAWWEVLGLHPECTMEELRKTYRTLAAQTHADAGGSDAVFQRINQAYLQGLKHLEGK